MSERRGRSGGHSANRRGAGGIAVHQMPWRIPLNPDKPTEPLSEEGVLAIHNGAMRVLEEIGIHFLNDESRAR